MLRSAQESIDQSIWPAFPPGIAIFVTVVAFNVLGDGLRDAFGREARGGRVGVGDVELASVSGTRADPNPDALLSVRDLSIRFPRPGTTEDVSVVRNVDFDIGRGQVMALVGESGSGKSISALSLLGLVPDPGRASASSISLDGRELVGLDFDELRSVRGKEIGLISQEPSAALNPAYTVGRQIAEPLIYHLGMGKKEARARAIELMTLVGIPSPEVRIDSFPHQFSGGMAQRVVIAMALSCNPKLLIADEPTTALDVTVQGQVLDLIGDLSRDLGVSVLLITHDLGVVADLASDVAVMYAGEIVEAGKLVEVFHDPQHPYTEGLIKAIPRNEQRGARLMTEPLLKIDDLTITFPGGKGQWPWQRQPDVRAVQNASIQIAPGETLGLVGESGSGKTTIGRAVLQFIKPVGGSIRLGEFDVTGFRSQQSPRRTAEAGRGVPGSGPVRWNHLWSSATSSASHSRFTSGNGIRRNATAAR
ncbi:UNVERIFIED_CONTAM: hypothetical protein GTU68_042009 [Idotea baltica]|nr:hypothetical protein [Idotea baltica]